MARLSSSEIKSALSDLQGWEGDESGIKRSYKFKDFVESMGFVNRVSLLAEKADHHPDIEISYNRVALTLVTHSEGGVTSNDTEMAAKINALG
ncbi:MAG TPA: 4a-hydroxytetrahydrobiopterin dehydratase [Dehalococcoidia bacterium]|nr:4a-hydroxytetrahydrobiopterin dehydratase [Dehalococcoidia bacterium]